MKLLPIVLLFSYTILAFAPESNLPKWEKIVRIGIVRKVNIIHVSNKKGICVTDYKSGVETEFSSGVWTMLPTANGIQIGEKKAVAKYFGPMVRIKSKDNTDFLTLGKRRYRGSFIIRKNDQGLLTVINELGIEEYLYGVVPFEAESQWPTEVLKAQAIISRTYALSNISDSKHTKDGFDLCSSQCCQVYGGVRGESAKVNQAVDETEGEILLYDKKPAVAFYSNSCGGYTEDVANVWEYPSSPEYLRSVPCHYCHDYPAQGWSCRLSKEFITNQLAKKIAISKIKTIRINKQSKFKRVISLRIVHWKGETTISAHRFRMYVASNKVRSTMFEMREVDSGRKYLFSGRGWGHGVGLCQWGARGMASIGYNYHRILKHYYPGTELVRY